MLASGFRRERSLTHKVIHSDCVLFIRSLKNNDLQLISAIDTEEFEHYNLRSLAS